jgi:hypothetical protein
MAMRLVDAKQTHPRPDIERKLSMTKETRVWSDPEWVCLFVNDGGAQATVSLTYDEAFDLAQKLMPRAEFKPDTIEELRQSARMIRKWIPDVYPANERGQVHFARAIMESVASVIERALAGKAPPTDEEVMAASGPRAA